MRLMSVISSFYFIIFLQISNCEIFTSYNDMLQLLLTEDEVIHAVEVYIYHQEMKLDKLKSLAYSDDINADVQSVLDKTDISHLLDINVKMMDDPSYFISYYEDALEMLKGKLVEMKKVHDISVKSPDDFLGNPINAFLLVKRLTIDWDLSTLLPDDSLRQAVLSNLTSKADILWPDKQEDLSGAALGLVRLQETYKLKTKDVAEGNILGIETAYRALTANDCFQLGYQCFIGKDYYYTILWMKEALQRMENEIDASVDETNILQHLAFSYYFLGKIKQALKYTEDILKLHPGHVHILANKKKLMGILDANSEGEEEENNDEIADEESDEKLNRITLLHPKGWNSFKYEILCRGEGEVNSKKKKDFSCFYKNGPSKFLMLAPIKTEIVHIHPTIFVFYDIVYDSEINNILYLAKPLLKRAHVRNVRTGTNVVTNIRISKAAFLGDLPQQLTAFDKRMEDLTDLNMETGEHLQVCNYGVGGHYEAHVDYEQTEGDSYMCGSTGNRISTLLLYLTNVEAGGATVFPHLGVSLWPRKGSAAFWYNLYPSGKPNNLTLHAACPVLVGNKWVCNKWLHEVGQEFRRPCGKNLDDNF